MSHPEDSQVHQDGGDALPAIFRPGIDTVMEEVCTAAGHPAQVSRQALQMAVQVGEPEGAATVHFSCTGGRLRQVVRVQREAYGTLCQLSRVGPQRAKLQHERFPVA